MENYKTKKDLINVLIRFSDNCPEIFKEGVRKHYPNLYYIFTNADMIIDNISIMYPLIKNYNIVMNPRLKENLVRVKDNNIELSSYLLLHPEATKYECNDILLHGMAHAINFELHKSLSVRPKENEHDESWREIALNIGCTGDICRPEKFAKTKGGQVIKMPKPVDKKGPKYTLYCTHETEPCDPETRKCKRKEVFHCKKHKLPMNIQQHYFGDEHNECVPIDGLPEYD